MVCIVPLSQLFICSHQRVIPSEYGVIIFFPYPRTSIFHACALKFIIGTDIRASYSYPVPKEVGRVGTNSPEFIRPISQRKGGIEALFAKQAAKGKQTFLTSSKQQMSPTIIGSPSSTSKDGTNAVWAIDIDASPPLPPACTLPKDIQQHAVPERDTTQKRAMDDDPEGIPPKKRTRDTNLSHDCE